MTNVTITLPAEYAIRVVEDLKRLRNDYPDLSTPAMYVVKVRLDVALADLEPVSTPVGGGALTGDVTDPCETQDAPVLMFIVTQPEDLDPAARYALWVCGLEGSHGRGVKCSGHSMRATGTGAEMAAVMGLYRHAYAEHIG